MQYRTNEKHERTPQASAGARHRALEALGEVGGALHELDYEDLTLTEPGMRLVRRAAMDVLRRFGAVDEGQMTLARALAVFLDQVFWEERSGGLILCADFPGQSFCLPIPRGWWSLKARTGRAQ